MRVLRGIALALMVVLIVAAGVMVVSWAESPYAPPVQDASGLYGFAAQYATPEGPSIRLSSDAAPQPGFAGASLVLTGDPAPPRRSWGPEQATGPPDTAAAGDYTTAWASRHPDGASEEWLSVTYDPPVEPVAVLIYESFNPGAVSTVHLYDDQKRLLKTLEQPANPVSESKRNLVLPVGAQLDGRVSRIDIIVRSQVVPGWNEIDAVGLIDVQGQTHWAKGATASSTFGDMTGMAINVTQLGSAHEARIQRLEQQVGELRGLIAQLRQQLTPQIRPAGNPGLDIDLRWHKQPEASPPPGIPGSSGNVLPGTGPTSGSYRSEAVLPPPGLLAPTPPGAPAAPPAPTAPAPGVAPPPVNNVDSSTAPAVKATTTEGPATSGK